MYFKYHVESVLNSNRDLLVLLQNSSLLKDSLLHDLRSKSPDYALFPQSMLETNLIPLLSDYFKFTYKKDDEGVIFQEIKNWATWEITRGGTLNVLCKHANEFVYHYNIRVELVIDDTELDRLLKLGKRDYLRVEYLKGGLLTEPTLMLGKDWAEELDKRGISLQSTKQGDDVEFFFSNNPSLTLKYHTGEQFEPNRVDEIVNELTKLAQEALVVYYLGVSKTLKVDNFKDCLPDTYSNNYYQVVTSVTAEEVDQDPNSLNVNLKVLLKDLSAKVTIEYVHVEDLTLLGVSKFCLHIKAGDVTTLHELQDGDTQFLNTIASVVYTSSKAKSLVDLQTDLYEINRPKVNEEDLKLTKSYSRTRANKGSIFPKPWKRS